MNNMTKLQQWIAVILPILMVVALTTLGYQVGYQAGVADGCPAVEDNLDDR